MDLLPDHPGAVRNPVVRAGSGEIRVGKKIPKKVIGNRVGHSEQKWVDFWSVKAQI